jgi:type I restriction enzyme, S subunit
VTPLRDNNVYWEPAEIPWVKTGEIDFAPITTTQESISRRALDACSLSLLPPKSVLVAITGEGRTRGRSAVLEIPAATNQHSVSILPNDTWDAYFLQLWMQSSYHGLRELSEGRGGSRSALSGGQIKALKIPAPHINEQRRIITRLKTQLAEADALRAALEVQLKELDALPQRILAQAFTPPQAAV